MKIRCSNSSPLRITSLAVLGGLALLVAASCSKPVLEDPLGTEEQVDARSDESESAGNIVLAYDCDEEMWLVSEYRPADNQMFVFLPGRTGLLDPQEVASGSKYSDGEIAVWSKGEEATVELIAEDAVLGCTVNRRRTVIEAAKLDGADFWGTGNEPGWSLKIFHDRMVLVTDYGQERHEAAIESQTPDPSAAMTEFRGSIDDVDLVVVLRGRPCQDDMSGEEFSTGVDIQLGERTLRGCGTALH